jgi:hypothetical protein
MTLSTIYPLYVNKVLKKGAKIEDLDYIIEWLTSLNKSQVEKAISEEKTLEEFFESANINENANLINGSICGYKIADIQNPLTKKIRMLDKIVDELANGKPLSKICRT